MDTSVLAAFCKIRINCTLKTSLGASALDSSKIYKSAMEALSDPISGHIHWKGNIDRNPVDNYAPNDSIQHHGIRLWSYWQTKSFLTIFFQTFARKFSKITCPQSPWQNTPVEVDWVKRRGEMSQNEPNPSLKISNSWLVLIFPRTWRDIEVTRKILEIFSNFVDKSLFSPLCFKSFGQLVNI